VLQLEVLYTVAVVAYTTLQDAYMDDFNPGWFLENELLYADYPDYFYTS